MPWPGGIQSAKVSSFLEVATEETAIADQSQTAGEICMKNVDSS
jgi:hypothetical protein